MKKRMLILLIASVSFVPAAFADQGHGTSLGEQPWNKVAGRATHCDGETKRLPADVRHSSGDDSSAGPPKAARAQ